MAPYSSVYTDADTHTATSGDSHTWNSWINTSATTSDNHTGVWTAWSGNSITYRFDGRDWQPAVNPLTPEERARREAEARERREQAAQREAEAKAQQKQAEAKAETTLRAHLTAEQIKSLDEQSEFIVRSQSGKDYRIRRGTSQNVYEIGPNGRETVRHCGVPDRRVPVGDVLLTQMLALKYDEAAFLRASVKRELTPTPVAPAQ